MQQQMQPWTFLVVLVKYNFFETLVVACLLKFGSLFSVGSADGHEELLAAVSAIISAGNIITGYLVIISMTKFCIWWIN